MSSYYLFLIVFGLHSLIYDVNPHVIKNFSNLIDLIETDAVPNITDYFTSPKFALPKCQCGANYIWMDGMCHPRNTSVEFLLSFVPDMLFHEVSTGDFDETDVTELQCNSSSVSLTLNNVAFTNYNTLFHMESGGNFTDSYCVEHSVDDEGAVVTQASVCVPSLKIPSCCPPAHYIDRSLKQCIANENITFNPPVRIGQNLINTTNVVPYHQQFPKCDFKVLQRRNLESDNITIQYQQSETILFEWGGIPHKSFPQMTLFPTEFCVTVEQDQNNHSSYSVIFWDDILTEFCNSNTSSVLGGGPNCDQVMYWLLLPLLILSSAFLIIILTLHAFMPELRKSIGSKITRCHVASLLAGFCMLILLHIPHDFNCKLYGPLVQVCFLATFFWLNVMCFDIWWKLRCHSPARETIQSSHTRFVQYSIYAWGTPLLIGIITVIMDNSPSLEDMPGIIIPGFGKKHCWFVDPKAALIYYFGIVAFLLAMNLFFFVWVFIILLKANCTYNEVLKNNPKSHARMLIYLKIYGVMGVTWICEYISWQEGTCEYWVITDIINSLRGFILFVIFFGNRKSIVKIGERFGSFNQAVHAQFSRSITSLRKLSLKSSSTLTSDADSRRTSETMSEVSQK